jgi:uncharacterized membrane protein (DUF106 family)
MKIKLLLTSVLASLLMAGSAFAMDSDALQKHMEELHEKRIERTTRAEDEKVQALEQQVRELERLIRMMMDEGVEPQS